MRACCGQIESISTAACIIEFRGAPISSDSVLLVMRELDDVLGLSDLAATALRDTRRGKNTVHRLDGLFRQSVFG